MIAHITLGILFMMMSASSDGILDYMKKYTIPIVPDIIMITFQSTEERTFCIGKMPDNTNRAAEHNATYALNFGIASNRT
jgi:hypothetical protein